MSILIDQTTRVLVQGITGKEGAFWTQHMVDMGTRVVAGVTPGKEGQLCCSAPVYHSVRNAIAEHKVDAAMVFVPPKFVLDAVLEKATNKRIKLPPLAVGIGFYLPAAVTTMLVIGAVCGWLYERAVAATPTVAGRFVFLTGGVFTDEARAFLDAPGRRWLTKPARRDELAAALDAVVTATAAA